MTNDSTPPEDSPPASPRNKRRLIKRQPTGRPPKPFTRPNIDVLDTLIRQRKLDHQDVAKAIGLKPALFSRSLHGGRDFAAREAVAMARLLNKSTDDMLRILGHSVASAGVPLVGKILPDHRVSPVLGERKGERVRVAEAYPDSVAYVYEPDNTMFIVDRDIRHDKPVIPSDAYGRWCVVEAEGQELPLFGRLEKAPQRGHLSLAPYFGDSKPRLVKVHSAAVVIAIMRP